MCFFVCWFSVGLTAWNVSQVAGLFAVFAKVVGVLTMLVIALSLRVRSGR